MKSIEFKPLFAIITTVLCFSFFFIKGVDNGIMVLCTLAVKHYFDSTASSVNNTKILNESMAKKNEEIK